MIRQAIERRIEKAPKAGYSTREPGDLAVQHVEQISYDQNNSGPEEPAESKQQAAPTLIATPTKVRMFGLICPRASQRTIASMIR
jgi:hypothetical protein